MPFSTPLQTCLGIPSVPAFLWPKHTKTETTVLVRLGRVVHWLALLPAALAVFLGCATSLSAGNTPDGNAYFLAGLAGALAFLLFGRALRYIFAGE